MEYSGVVQSGQDAAAEVLAALLRSLSGPTLEVLMEKLWIEKVATQELCTRYCQTIDAQDSDGWARCFLPDGAFEFDGHVVRGYEALREYAEAHTRVLREAHDPQSCAAAVRRLSCFFASLS